MIKGRGEGEEKTIVKELNELIKKLHNFRKKNQKRILCGLEFRND